MADVLAAKMATDLITLVGEDSLLARVADTCGGEYAGPCPMCGGKDRFRVQKNAPLEKKPAGQRWMCRQCSPKWGDAIGYVEKRRGLDFQGALAWLARRYSIPEPAEPAKQAEPDEIDLDRWTKAIELFSESCERMLWQPEGEKARAYLHGRGLNDESLRTWNIGFSPNGGGGDPAVWGCAGVYLPRGIVIPCWDSDDLHYVKVRQSQGDPKYRIIKGGHIWPYGLDTFRDNATVFLFEAELDVILAHSTRFTGAGYAALPAGQPIKPEYAPFFESVDNVIVVYDNDEPGIKAARALSRIPGFVLADPLPEGKDLGEYYKATGSLEAVFEYLYDQVGKL